MINYKVKINERTLGQSIVGEAHIIGIVGTATYAPGLTRLIEVPQGPAPAVTIPGYTEILSGTPTGLQFLVNYTTGVITFDSAQDGNNISASYTGLGSEIAAEDVNELQNPLSSVVNQTIVYNWPLPPTVTWSLSSGQAVTSLNSLTDNITLAAGANVTITPSGNTLTISSTGGGGGGGTLPIRVVTTSTSPLSSDYTLLVDATGGPINITLALASTMAQRIFDIKKIDSTANLVDVVATAPDNIDGASTFPLSVQWQSVTVQSKGSAPDQGWWVL